MEKPILWTFTHVLNVFEINNILFFLRYINIIPKPRI